MLSYHYGAIMALLTRMKEQAFLTIPCHWNTEVIDEMTASVVAESSPKIKEVYGVLADGGPVGHGRASKTVVDVGRQQAIEYRQHLADKGINFTYLLNAPHTVKEDSEYRLELNKYLEWILGELQPDALTISSHDLMQYARTVDRDVPIHVSTIAGVKTVADLETFMDVRPNRVVPHHDIGKRWNDLKDLVSFGRENGVDCEVMVTESCLFHCPKREAHYKYLAQKDADGSFHITCNSQKLLHPREFLLAGGIVRPEDVQMFGEMGVKYFKITGRSKPASWLPEVIKAYQDRRYEGNLVRLLGIDPSLRAEDWIFINNRSLDQYLSGFPQTQSYHDETSYADSWINRMYQDGNFYLSDQSSYAIQNGELVLQRAGDEAAPIIHKEGRV